MVFNIDESPLNRDWTKSEWTRPAYKTDAFFKSIADDKLSLTEFKQSAMYLRAVRDGAIVNDRWVLKSKRPER